jgi:hypothetical protein
LKKEELRLNGIWVGFVQVVNVYSIGRKRHISFMVVTIVKNVIKKNMKGISNMKVIAIWEECHGFIGIAKDMPSAFEMLVKEHWVNPLTEFYDSNEGSFTLETVKTQLEVDSYEEALAKLYECETEDYFIDLFSFNEETVYERD